MNELKTYFNNMTERERKLVIVSGIVIVIALFYWLIWSPLQTNVEQAKNRYLANESTLQWVEEQSIKAQQLRRSGIKSRSFTGSLAQTVNTSSSQFGIAISRMQPQDEELLVWVDQASFDSVIAWLNYLEVQGISIIQTDIAEADVEGFVKIRRLQIGKS